VRGNLRFEMDLKSGRRALVRVEFELEQVGGERMFRFKSESAHVRICLTPRFPLMETAEEIGEVNDRIFEIMRLEGVEMTSPPGVILPKEGSN